MTTKTLRPLFFATFAASLTFAASVRAAIPPAEYILPSDTLFMFTVPDCNALRATAHQSPQWMLWNDPAMKPFHDKFMAKWSESFVAPLENDLGVKPADFADLPQGQFTFAVTQNGWNGIEAGKKPGILLLLDAGNKSDLLKTNIAALQKKWVADGKPMRTEIINGISFHIVPLSSNDVPGSLSWLVPQGRPAQEPGTDTKPAPDNELVVGQFESLLIVGDSKEAVGPVAARLTGGALPPLDDNAAFAADKLARFHGTLSYYAWFNAKTVISTVARIQAMTPNPDTPGAKPQVPLGKIFTASGLAGLKSASMAYRENRDGAQVDFFIAAPESERQGIFKMIAPVSKNAAPPSFVPADAVKFWRWRVDGRDAWDTLQKMLADISPEALSGLNTAINMANATAQQKDPSFDVRKNLFANLGDDWMSYQKAPAGTKLQDLSSAPTLFLFAAVNADQAAIAIKNVAAMSSGRQKAPDPRDFLGKKIYSIPLPSQRARSTTPGPATPVATHFLYCAASGGYVAMTTDVSMMEEFLRSSEKPPKPLGGTAGLVDATAHIGGAGNGLFGYENQRETMRTLFSLFKDMSANDTGGVSPLAALPQTMRDWMDFSLLPDYDTVSKYFYFSVYTGGTTVDGLSLKVFAPRPPGLN